MSAAQHTPGPWTMGDSDLPVSKLAVCGGTRKHQTLLRLVSADFTGMPVDEALANARLIAAAPDLLAVLRQCAAALRQCNHVPGVTEQAIWAADAAIARTGGAA